LADEELDGEAQYLVYAALQPSTDEQFQEPAGLDGREEMARCRAQKDKSERAVKPARVYLRQIEVEDFRGIGPVAGLDLHPGRG
jgi:hypothetical protein